MSALAAVARVCTTRVAARASDLYRSRLLLVVLVSLVMRTIARATSAPAMFCKFPFLGLYSCCILHWICLEQQPTYAPIREGRTSLPFVMGSLRTLRGALVAGCSPLARALASFATACLDQSASPRVGKRALACSTGAKVPSNGRHPMAGKMWENQEAVGNDGPRFQAGVYCRYSVVVSTSARFYFSSSSSSSFTSSYSSSFSSHHRLTTTNTSHASQSPPSPLPAPS